MKKYPLLIIIPFFLFMVCAYPLHAQKTADELLKQVVDKTAAYDNLAVDFYYTMQNELAGISESNEGRLLLQGDAFKLEVAGQTIINDGETVWVYLHDSHEVMITHADEGDGTFSPASILTSYYDDFEVSFISTSEMQSSDLKTIELIGDGSLNFSKLHIRIDDTKMQIESFTLFDDNGSTYTYHIRSLQSNVGLEPGTFSFQVDDHPDLEDIIDMR